MIWKARTRALLALATVLTLPTLAQDGPSLAERSTALDAPSVGRVLAVDGPIDVGRGRFEGGTVRLLSAAGEPVGVLVDGGRFSYRVEDRFSVPVARRNVKRATSLAPAEEGGVLTVADGVKTAAVWDRALAAALDDAHPPTDGEPPAASTVGLPAEIRGMLTDRFFTAPSVELLAAEGRDLSYGLIAGAGEDLIVWTDPALALEGVAALSKLTGRAGRFSGSRVFYHLAVQPLGRPWWEPPSADLRSTHTLIEIDNPGGRRLDLVTRTTLSAERGGERIWRAELADAIFDGERLAALDVSRVLVDGRPADHLHKDDTLLVDLGRPLAAGETTIVEIAHSGDLAIRPGNDSYWYLSTWPWYPRPAAPDGQLSTFEIEVRAPAPFLPYASGSTVERRDEKVGEGGKDVVHVLRTRLDVPMHLPVVAAGRFHVFSETKNDVDCNLTTYVFGKERPAEILRGIFFSATEIFEQFFGIPYPFDEVDVVEINQWGFGQAPAGVIFITQEAYNPLSSDVSRFFSQGVNGRFVHEVAHAWWGHVLKTGRPSEEWLAESFADYSAALAMRTMMPGKKGEQEFKSTLRAWKANAERIGDGGSVYLANFLAGEDEQDFADRTYLLYNKGPLVLHALRQELARQLGSEEQGDRYFQALLRTFLGSFTNQYGETRHLVGILNQMTGKDWQPWFERYVYGTEMPEVRF